MQKINWIVIGVLLTIIGFQYIRSRGNSSELEQHKERVNTGLDEAGKQQQEAITNNIKAERGIQTAKGRLDTIRSELDTIQDIGTESQRIIDRLKARVQSLPERCICGN